MPSSSEMLHHKSNKRTCVSSDMLCYELQSLLLWCLIAYDYLLLYRTGLLREYEIVDIACEHVYYFVFLFLFLFVEKICNFYKMDTLHYTVFFTKKIPDLLFFLCSLPLGACHTAFLELDFIYNGSIWSMRRQTWWRRLSFLKFQNGSWPSLNIFCTFDILFEFIEILQIHSKGFMNLKFWLPSGDSWEKVWDHAPSKNYKR